MMLAIYRSVRDPFRLVGTIELLSGKNNTWLD